MPPLVLAAIPHVVAAVGGVLASLAADAMTTGEPDPVKLKQAQDMLQREAANRMQTKGISMQAAQKEVEAELGPTLEKGLAGEPSLLASALAFLPGMWAGSKVGGKLARALPGAGKAVRKGWLPRGRKNPAATPFKPGAATPAPAPGPTPAPAPAPGPTPTPAAKVPPPAPAPTKPPTKAPLTDMERFPEDYPLNDGIAPNGPAFPGYDELQKTASRKVPAPAAPAASMGTPSQLDDLLTSLHGKPAAPAPLPAAAPAPSRYQHPEGPMSRPEIDELLASMEPSTPRVAPAAVAASTSPLAGSVKAMEDIARSSADPANRAIGRTLAKVLGNVQGQAEAGNPDAAELLRMMRGGA
jgi:hypothetical protein